MIHDFSPKKGESSPFSCITSPNGGIPSTRDSFVSRCQRWGLWPYALTLPLFRKESGFISGLVAVLHDATEEKRRAGTLTSYQKKTIIMSCVHPFLTSVKSYLEALDDGALDEEIAPQLYQSFFLDETNRMMRMISDLLALSSYWQ